MQIWYIKLKVMDDGVDDAGRGNEYLLKQDIEQMIVNNALPMAGLKVEVLDMSTKNEARDFDKED